MDVFVPPKSMSIVDVVAAVEMLEHFEDILKCTAHVHCDCPG